MLEFPTSDEYVLTWPPLVLDRGIAANDCTIFHAISRLSLTSISLNAFVPPSSQCFITLDQPSPLSSFHFLFFSFHSYLSLLTVYHLYLGWTDSTTLLHPPPLPPSSSLSIPLRRSSNSRSLPAAFQSRDAFIVSADRETASRDNCEILIITRKRGALGVAQLGHLRSRITSRHTGTRHRTSFVRSRADARNERGKTISFMPVYAALNNIVMQNSSRWDGVNAAALISWSIFGRFDRCRS